MFVFSLVSSSLFITSLYFWSFFISYFISSKINKSGTGGLHVRGALLLIPEVVWTSASTGRITGSDQQNDSFDENKIRNKKTPEIQ